MTRLTKEQAIKKKAKIATLLGQGIPMAKIAEQLSCSLRTVAEVKSGLGNKGNNGNGNANGNKVQQTKLTESNPIPCCNTVRKSLATQAGSLISRQDVKAYIRSLGYENYIFGIIDDLTEEHLDFDPPKPRLTRAQLARKYGKYDKNRSWATRIVNRLLKDHLIYPDPGISRLFLKNPGIFGSPSSTPVDQLLQDKYVNRVHRVPVTCEVAPNSKLINESLRKRKAWMTIKGQGIEELGWEKKLITDAPEIAKVWAKLCKLPESKFKPISCPNQIKFYVLGYGNDYEQAKNGAWRSGKILHDMFQNKYSLELGFSTGSEDEVSRYKHTKIPRDLITDDSPEENTMHGVGDKGGKIQDDITKATDRATKDIGSLKDELAGIKGELKDSKTGNLSTAELTSRMNDLDKRLERIETKIDRIEPTFSRLVDVLERLAPA
nr:hypothetical protein [Candidatus Sigynarchaeota archaeon]